MAELQAAKTQTLRVDDLQVQSVVVYADMAEVSRAWKCELVDGRNEIIIEKFQRRLNSDTLRVTGKGQASVAEVLYKQELEAKKPQIDEPEISKDDFDTQILAIHKKRKVMHNEKARLNRRRAVVDGIADRMMDAGGQTNGNLLTAATLEQLGPFLDTHQSELTKVDARLTELEDSLTELQAEQDALNLKWGRQDEGNVREMNRKCVVMLDCKEACQVELVLVYQISGASWTSKYDIRADSIAKNVTIAYYGIIKQNTGENWNDTSISLSTAKPSPIKQVPELGTATVDFEQFRQPVMYKSRSSRGPTRAMKSMIAYDGPRNMLMSSSAPREDDGVMMCDSMEDFAVDTAQVSSGLLSATYDIPQRTTVKTGNTEQKLTVAEIPLTATFEYKSVPKITAKAFLTARLKNTSAYLLLAGPSSVFLDNTFVSNADFDSVSPNEEFSCLLGVDESVKIEYKPCQKYTETYGILSRSEAQHFKQLIVVKNTKSYEVKIQVQDQVPLSRNEQIKVSVVSPNLPKDPKEKDRPSTTASEKSLSDQAPVSKNAANNVVWNSSVKAGKSLELLLHYTVEKPAGQAKLEFTSG